MGVYTRQDSPWYWLWLERPGRPALREKTRIPVHAPTALQRKTQRAQAEDAYRARMGELARAGYDLPTALPARTFAALADWYETHVTAHKRGAAREREILQQLRKHFGPLQLADLTLAHVREWMTARRAEKVPRSSRTVSVATVNRELDVLKHVLGSAVPTYLDANPLIGLKRLRAPLEPMRVLAHDEERRLLAAVHDARDRALLVAGLDTIARLGSLLALEWRDDHGDHLEFRNPKAGPSYRVPVSARLRAALDALPVDERGRYIFAHRRTTKDPEGWRNAVKLMLRRACARAGIPYGRARGGITFHALRHTGATRMIAAGVDLRTVQELGGWSSLRQLARYAHPTADAKRRAVETVSEA
jgi:integrase